MIQQSEEEDLEPHERKKLKKTKAMVDSSEEDEEDDEDKIREELKDLIDDNPIESEGSDGEDSDVGPSKRKKSDDEDELDDRLEDEDYDLIEENLGVKVQRVSFSHFSHEKEGKFKKKSVSRNDLSVFGRSKMRRVTRKRPMRV